jgi:peptidoglycan-associated lipoprotein
MQYPVVFGRVLLSVVCLGLVACGTQVKLDDVPVTDRSGAAAATAAALGKKSESASDASTKELASGIDAKPLVVGQGSGVDGAQGAKLPAQLAEKLVYFDYDSYVVKPEFANLLEAYAKYLKADAKRSMALEGHTDERGGREYNLALGQKRAEAVRRSLVLLGVADAQLEAVSFGKEKLVDTETNEAAYAKNRRVELVVR